MCVHSISKKHYGKKTKLDCSSLPLGWSKTTDKTKDLTFYNEGCERLFKYSLIISITIFPSKLMARVGGSGNKSAKSPIVCNSSNLTLAIEKKR